MAVFLSRRSIKLSSILFSLLLICDSDTVRANDHVNSKSESKSSSAAINSLIICLSLVAVIGFSVLLLKLWQKRKREEQHARLLKLFEDDDDLEVELGIRC
ncbi:hypothetical protein G4B88_008685 [Cannabis sativa]|uniref:Transmembrane protein n=1 Tax=Cannabis sativa TaxID=3483 RepID=A0A7J6DL91_CANSA|nr:hypothetical protein G4B88_008685 [Cannabis sativa]